MKLVDQWRAIETQLPENWADARLELLVGDDARCDRDGVTGEVRIVRALSSTYPAYTQGPVWYVGGRTT